MHVAQVAMSICITLCRCKAVQSHSLGVVLRNNITVPEHAAQVELSV